MDEKQLDGIQETQPDEALPDDAAPGAALPETDGGKPETAAEQNADDDPPLTLRGFLGDLMDIAEAAVVTIFVFQLIFAYLLKPVAVSGGSMNNTLFDADQLLMVTHFLEPRDGNIVVIDDLRAGHFSDEAQTQVYESGGLNIVIIKRLIAQGGEEVNIDFESGTVTVNGTVRDEPYIKELTTRNDLAFSYPFTVPEGYYFVMGDNRGGSTDSRNPAVALVPEDQLLGVVLCRYGREDSRISTWTEKFAWLL